MDTLWDQISEDIQEAIKGNKVQVQILLQHPGSEGALTRSYREKFSLNPANGLISAFSQYKGQDHSHELLYAGLNNTIIKLQVIQNQLKTPKNLEVKLSEATPSCFMLLVDNTVIVEHYHYGWLQGAQALGGQMPLVEYINTQRVGEDNLDRLFQIFHQQGRIDTFALMEDHFNFVFNHLSVNAF